MYVSTSSNITNTVLYTINVREHFCKDVFVAIIHKMALKPHGYLTHGTGSVFLYISASKLKLSVVIIRLKQHRQNDNQLQLYSKVLKQ